MKKRKTTTVYPCDAWPYECPFDCSDCGPCYGSCDDREPSKDDLLKADSLDDYDPTYLSQLLADDEGDSLKHIKRAADRTRGCDDYK